MNYQRIVFLLFWGLFSTLNVVAQTQYDRIVLKDGSERQVVVYEVQKMDVKCEYPVGTGTIASISLKDIAKIVYVDGHEELFSVLDAEKKERPSSGNVFSKGSVLVNAEIGIPFSGISFYKVPPLLLRTEFGVADFGKAGALGVGATFGYDLYLLGTQGMSIKIPGYGVTGGIGYHFTPVPRLDLHARLGAGYVWRRAAINMAQQIEDYSKPIFQALAGVSYLFIPAFGLTLEAGWLDRGGVVLAGLSFRF